MSNTYSLKQIWDSNYQVSHFKQPVFRAFAEEKFQVDLNQGATFNRQFASDLVVNSMGANGSYTVQGFTNTNESGVVNKKEEATIQIVEWQKLQDHLPTQMKYTTKAANALWLQVDAFVLYTIQQSAASYLDDASINGSAGTTGAPIVTAPQNVQSLFTSAIQQLQLLNVVYDPNKTLAKDVKLENISDALCAAISPQVYNNLIQYIGGKTTVLGDTISRNGHVGMFMGFNLFVSNQLPWEGLLKLGTNPTAGDTITLLSGVAVSGVSQAITLTFRATPSVAGDVVIASTAAKTVTNLVNALKAPYTTISNTADTGFIALGASSAAMTVTQAKLLNNLNPVQTAVTTLGGASSASGTTLDLFVAGLGNVPVSSVLTTGTNGWGYQCQHNIFGTSKSVSVLMQSNPHLYINPVSGSVAKDMVTWTLYGVKVFTDQSFQLVDAKIDSSNFGANGTAVNVSN